MEGTGLLGHAPFQSREKGLRGAISKFPWLLELGALLLSSSALFTAIAILASYQGKLVTEWSFPTSINTVIAVLGAINKATLAFAVSACIGQHKWNLFKAKSGKLGLFECFDEASRGPWGSLWLILHTKGKYAIKSEEPYASSFSRSGNADCTIKGAGEASVLWS